MGILRRDDSGDLRPVPLEGNRPLTAEEKLDGWRLLSLIDAYREHKEPLDMEDIAQLGLIARAKADLHTACKALRHGCALEQAVDIFT